MTSPSFNYGDVDIFRSPYTFKHNFDNDYSQDFITDYGYNDTTKLCKEKSEQADRQEETSKEERNGEEEEIPSWTEFTENTTFHGIKYIFQSGFRFRR